MTTMSSRSPGMASPSLPSRHRLLFFFRARAFLLPIALEERVCVSCARRCGTVNSQISGYFLKIREDEKTFFLGLNEKHQLNASLRLRLLVVSHMNYARLCLRPPTRPCVSTAVF